MMFSVKSNPMVVATVTLAAMLGSAAAARAEVCGTQECPQGFTCVETKVDSTVPVCAAGAPDCKVPAPQPAPMVVRSCQPKTCTSDASCGAGMVCHEQKISQCSVADVAPCAPNTKCDRPPPSPPTCTTTSSFTCAYKWQLPCNADADCGAGFSCKPSVTGACSGGSGSTGGGTPTSGSGGSAGAAYPARPDGGVPPSCTTVESFPGYCAPKATSCTVDGDCPASWKCTESPVAIGGGATGTSAGPSTGVAAPFIAPPILRDGGTPPPVSKMCTPPLGLGYGGDVAVGDPKAPPSPTGTSGTPPTTGGSRESANGTLSDGGGCSVTPGHNADATATAAGLALLVFAIARRKRAPATQR